MKFMATLFAAASTMAACVPAVAADPTYRVVSTIKTDSQSSAQSIALDPSGRRLYVGRQGLVEIVDLETGSRVGQVVVPGQVGGIAIAPELNRGFASSQSAGTLTIFDLRTLQPIKVLSGVGAEVGAVAFEPQSKRVFVSSLNGGRLTAVSAESGDVVGTASLGGRLRGVVADTRGNVFVADEQRDTVHVVDATSLKSKSSIPTWPAGKPTAMHLDNKERRIYVATASGQLVVVDPDIGQIVGHVPIGSGDAGIAAQYGANRFVRLFVPTADGQVTIVKNPKLAAFVESRMPAAGVKTAAVAVDPKSGKAYVAGPSEILVLSN